MQKHELHPLAQQIVYVDLTIPGLSPAGAAKILLDGIGFKGPFPAVPPNWPGAVALEAGNDASGQIVIIAPGSDGRLASRPIPLAADSDYGFDAPTLLRNIAESVGDFSADTQRVVGQFRYSQQLQDAAVKLHVALQKYAEANFRSDGILEINRKLVWCLRMVVLDTRNGNIPLGDAMAYHEAELQGHYVLLGNLYPALKIYRAAHARDRFVPPTGAELAYIEQTFAGLSSASVSGKALSPELSAEIGAVAEAVVQADKIEVGKSREDQETKKELQVEAYMEAAKKTTAVWSWLSNPHEKFLRLGRSADEAGKAIENYEKLYGKLAMPALEFMKYLAKWFF